MKKPGAIIVTCFLGLTLAACSNSAPSPTSPGSATGSGSAVIEPETPSIGSAEDAGSSTAQNDPNTRIFRDCTITITGYSLSTDENGDPALRVEYLFENNSQSSASFSTTVIPNAYQDETGTYEEALSYTTPAEADLAYSALLKRIQPGETTTCAGYYKLESAETPVYLKIVDLRDSSAEALTCTIDIAKLFEESTHSADVSSTDGSADNATDTAQQQ